MKTNHHRSFVAQKDSERYRGSAPAGIGRISALAGTSIGASWGGDNSNGHRGYAAAKRGAKKFVNSRFRFHEKAATRRLSTTVEG